MFKKNYSIDKMEKFLSTQIQQKLFKILYIFYLLSRINLINIFNLKSKLLCFNKEIK